MINCVERRWTLNRILAESHSFQCLSLVLTVATSVFPLRFSSESIFFYGCESRKLIVLECKCISRYYSIHHSKRISSLLFRNKVRARGSTRISPDSFTSKKLHARIRVHRMCVSMCVCFVHTNAISICSEPQIHALRKVHLFIKNPKNLLQFKLYSM